LEIEPRSKPSPSFSHYEESEPYGKNHEKTLPPQELVSPLLLKKRPSWVIFKKKKKKKKNEFIGSKLYL
jgi:hypothetical protein